VSANDASVPPPGRAWLAGLFLLSLAVLALEVLLSRIVSVMMMYFLAYGVIGLAFLGLAAGASAVTVARRWSGPGALARLSAAAGLATLLGVALACRLGFDPGLRPWLVVGLSVAVAVTLVPPFFAAGAALSLAFAEGGAPHRLYAVNLAGSAAGCLLALPALRLLGAERCVILAAALFCAAGACFAARRAGLAALAGAVLLLLPWAPRALPIEPFPLLGKIVIPPDDSDSVRRFSRWGATGRIDVHELTDVKLHLPGAARLMLVSQDGSAPTFLLRFEEPDPRRADFTENLPFAYAHWLRPGAATLVIGAGGGLDLLTAVHHGASRVDGVELNERTVEAVGTVFREFTRGVYHLPGVRVFQDEGRSFLRRSRDRYDVIQLTGVDTGSTVLGGAANLLAEAYLYTVEAFVDYLEHLADDGVLSITYIQMTPGFHREKFLALALEALARAGAARPADHLLVTEKGMLFNLLVRRTPFPPAEVERLIERAHRANQRGAALGIDTGPRRDFAGFAGELRAPHRPALLPGGAGDPELARLVAAAAAGRAREAWDASPFHLEPPTDDSPFFFRKERFGPSFRHLFTPDERTAGLVLILLPTGALILLGALLILGPLFGLRGRGERTEGAGRFLCFFTATGLGYLAAQMAMIQSLTLFLGHPARSVTVTLCAMIGASGLGALWAGRRPRPARRLLLGSLLAGAAALVVVALLRGPLTAALLGAPFAVRAAGAALLVGLPGFFLGIPFPTALGLLRDRPRLIAWAFAVNGTASVAASFLGILLAMALGFRAVLLVAAAIYVLAAAVIARAARPGVTT
jgi:hypothetical protein